MKKKILLKILLLSILLLVLLINKNRTGNFNEFRFTALGDQFENATITEILISENNIKIQTDTPIKNGLCKITDKNNEDIKALCTLPISSDIAYIIFDEEIPNDFNIITYRYDIDTYSNYSSITNINEYNISNEQNQYLFNKKYILSNNSYKLLNTFPTREELNSMLEIEFETYLFDNRGLIYSNIQMLEIEISNLESVNSKLQEKILKLNEKSQTVELEKSLSEISKNKDRLDILYIEHSRYDKIKIKGE